jgi:hypothetical protein
MLGWLLRYRGVNKPPFCEGRRTALTIAKDGGALLLTPPIGATRTGGITITKRLIDERDPSILSKDGLGSEYRRITGARTGGKQLLSAKRAHRDILGHLLLLEGAAV